MIERLVDEYTSGELLEEWDLDELETQLRLIWPVGIDVATLAPETVDREKLKDALDDDAMSAYDDRETQLGEELMRHLERSILLQVIDNRWREHLFDMDYLREGIHLRGFAQIDPLVAYKNEGFTMFSELMHSIWDEFSKLVFRAEIEVEPARERLRQRRQPADRARLLRRHRRGPALGAGTGGGRRLAEPARSTSPPSAGRRRRGGRDRGQRRARQSRPQRPLLVRSRARSTRSATGPRAADRSVREFIRAFNERDLDAFVAVLDPEVELHSGRGLRKGIEAARIWATREPGGVQQTIELDAALRGRDRGRRRPRGGADHSPLALGGGRRAGRRGRDGLALRAARRRVLSWRPYEDRAEALRAGRLRPAGSCARQ